MANTDNMNLLFAFSWFPLYFFYCDIVNRPMDAQLIGCAKKNKEEEEEDSYL
jgi:hypothetical protein